MAMWQYQDSAEALLAFWELATRYLCMVDLAEVSTGHPQQFMTSNYSQGTSSFIFGL